MPYAPASCQVDQRLHGNARPRYAGGGLPLTNSGWRQLEGL